MIQYFRILPDPAALYHLSIFTKILQSSNQSKDKSLSESVKVNKLYWALV